MTLRPAVFEDWKDLLDWRNDPVTREQSINKEPIDPKAHQSWLKRSLENPNREILMLMNEGQSVGMLRFDVYEDGHELSWMVGTNSRGKGYGKQLLYLGLEGRKGVFYAKIYRGNPASVKMAEYVGFRQEEEAEDGLLTFRQER